MVRLTMTPALVVAIEEAQRSKLDLKGTSETSEPSLDNPAVGNPISHGQIIALSKLLSHNQHSVESDSSSASQPLPSSHLDDLLRGARIYNEPPKPKAEPVSKPIRCT